MKLDEAELERLLVNVRRAVSPLGDLSGTSAGAIQADAEAILAEGAVLEAEIARAVADGSYDAAAAAFLRCIIELGMRSLHLQTELWLRRTRGTDAVVLPTVKRSDAAGGTCRARRSR